MESDIDNNTSGEVFKIMILQREGDVLKLRQECRACNSLGLQMIILTKLFHYRI